MKSLLLAGALSLAAGMAAAAEPLRLDDAALDRVAAGALSGSEFEVAVAVPGGATGAGGSVINDSAPVSADATASSPDGSFAFAQLAGKVFNRTTPLSSLSVGLYQGQVQSEGQGTARTSIGGIAEGVYAIRQANLITIPGTNGRQIGYTFGFALGGDNAPPI